MKELDAYLKIKREQEGIIKDARAKLALAKEEAELCPVPTNLKPATAEDIISGQVIWLDGDDGYVWRIVADVWRPSDAFKGYDTDDGCRYGLHGAYIEQLFPEVR